MLIVGSGKGEQIQEIVKGWNQFGNFLSEERRIICDIQISGYKKGAIY